jgi:DNA-binding transcriptional ArsR family regulator
MARHAGAVKPADELGSPEVSALLEMLEAAPLNMRRFVQATRASPARARTALTRLTDAGLVEVERLKQGATEISEIAFTKLGREVAAHFAAADRAMARARAKR